VSAFANCGRAVAHVRGSYVPSAAIHLAGLAGYLTSICSCIRNGFVEGSFGFLPPGKRACQAGQNQFALSAAFSKCSLRFNFILGQQ
jgi:hypothetical protein